MPTLKTKLLLVAVATALIALNGCGGGGSSPAPGPTAVITCAEGSSISLGTTLHLSGASSVPLHGKILAYMWEAAQPNNRHDPFLPDASSRDVTLTPAARGTYTILLRVTDSISSSPKWAALDVTVN